MCTCDGNSRKYGSAKLFFYKKGKRLGFASACDDGKKGDMAVWVAHRHSDALKEARPIEYAHTDEPLAYTRFARCTRSFVPTVGRLLAHKSLSYSRFITFAGAFFFVSKENSNQGSNQVEGGARPSGHF